jgi:TP901 family phage tail tape measure protein
MAARIKGITIEINGDSTKLTKALADVDHALKTTQSNLRDLNRALKLDPGNSALLKDKQVELANAIDATKEKLEKEKEALEQMKNTQGFDANSEAARNLQTQIDLDTAALKELEAQARQSASVLGTQMQVAGQKIQEVGEKIKGVGDKLAGIGQTLTTRVTMPIVGAFAASTKAAVDWESAFTGVQKTVDASAEEYDQLAKNIQNMATETASSANEIAGVMEIAGQLGISGVDDLTAFTKTMVELNDTTNLTAEDAATSLARFMNITGENAANVSNLGSAIVDLGNNFATSESEIVAMSTRLASAGTIAGLSATDILALATAMSSVGIEAEAGGTAMSQTLKTISSEFYAFRDGETEGLEYIANVAGMSAEAFADAWEGDPVTAIQAFVTGLSRVKDEGDNVFAVLGEMGMTGIRQTNMIQALALASDKLGSAIQTSSRAYEENTALSVEAEKRYGTMAAKMSQLKERFVQVGVSIGEILMPYVEKLMDKLEGLIEKWNGLDEGQKKAVLKFAAIAAAIGPVLLVVGKLVASVGSIVTVFGKAVSGVGTLISSMGGLSGVIAAITGPIGIAIAAITALVAGFVYLYNTNEQFRASIQQVVTTLQTNLAGALERIKPALASLKEAFDGLMTMLAPVFELIFRFIAGVVNGIASAAGPIIETITNIISFITNIIQAFIALINGDFEGCFNYLSEAFNNWVMGMLSFIEAFIQMVLGFFEMFGVNLQASFTTMWTNVKTTVSEALAFLKLAITTTWNYIKTWLSITLTNIKTKFEEIFDKIKTAITERIEGAKNAIIEGMEAAADYIKSLPQKFYDWGKDMVQNLIDGIQAKIDALRAKISELAGMVASYIHFSEPDVGPLSDFHTYMPDMIDELVNGINQGIPRVAQAMNGLTQNMVPQANVQGMANNSTNTFNINVYGAQGQNVSELADVIEQRITENVMRRGVAFG